MTVQYILSAEIEYDKLICADAGPAYAANMGWPYDTINNIGNYNVDVLIIDNRLSPAECERITSYIKDHSDSFFGLCITDPGEYNYYHWYYNFLAAAAKYPNTFVIAKYHAAGLLNIIKSAYGLNRYIALGYPYDEKKEINRTGRKRKVIFTGAVSDVYPERKHFLKRFKRSPLFFLIDVLAHPGYADIGQQRKHNFVGDDFIRFLSGYMFMYVSGSRYLVELLKYNECAYAGALPVGVPPETYPDEIKALFFRPVFSIKGIQQFFNYVCFTKVEDAKIEIETLRDYLRQQNSPVALNGRLTGFIAVLAGQKNTTV
jgi:hypothetical protein